MIHVSERARQDYLKRVRPTTHPGVVIHNGVEVQRYAAPPDEETRRSLLRELKIDSGRPVLLNVARLHREKGHSDLRTALNRSVRDIRDLCWCWPGRGGRAMR